MTRASLKSFESLALVVSCVFKLPLFIPHWRHTVKGPDRHRVEWDRVQRRLHDWVLLIVALPSHGQKLLLVLPQGVPFSSRSMMGPILCASKHLARIRILCRHDKGASRAMDLYRRFVGHKRESNPRGRKYANKGDDVTESRLRARMNVLSNGTVDVGRSEKKIYRLLFCVTLSSISSTTRGKRFQ